MPDASQPRALGLAQPPQQIAHNPAQQPAMFEHRNTHYTPMAVHTSHCLRLRLLVRCTARGLAESPWVLACCTKVTIPHSRQHQSMHTKLREQQWNTIIYNPEGWAAHCCGVEQSYSAKFLRSRWLLITTPTHLCSGLSGSTLQLASPFTQTIPFQHNCFWHAGVLHCVRQHRFRHANSQNHNTHHVTSWPLAVHHNAVHLGEDGEVLAGANVVTLVPLQQQGNSTSNKGEVGQALQASVCCVVVGKGGGCLGIATLMPRCRTAAATQHTCHIMQHLLPPFSVMCCIC